ncbi:MAG: response regulator transcription factor [Casimicrobiaceae bacterium]
MRVLLAETHSLVREGLKRVALAIDPACAFVETTDAAAARAAMSGDAAFDIALFDDALLGAADLTTWRRDYPRLLMVVLVADSRSIASARMLEAGINALLPRSSPVDVIAAALRVALAGNVIVRGMAGDDVSPYRAPDGNASARRGRGPLNLTVRQYEVLALVAQGHANKVIAGELGIGLRTVKGHVSVVLRALHTDNRADAGRVARRWLARTASLRTLTSAASAIC